MKLIVNGEPLEMEDSGGVPSLLELLGADGGRVAVMVNDLVVSREAWSTITLAEGDRVEVLTFAGGG